MDLVTFSHVICRFSSRYNRYFFYYSDTGMLFYLDFSFCESAPDPSAMSEISVKGKLMMPGTDGPRCIVLVTSWKPLVDDHGEVIG